MRKGLGVDLGGKNLRVFSLEKTCLWQEPAYAAVDKTTGTIYAIGESAVAFDKQNPLKCKLIRPFAKSFAEQYRYMQMFLVYVKKKYFAESDNKESDVLLWSAPTGLTESQTHAMVDIALGAGFARAYLMDAPLAALLGSDYQARDSLVVVHIGASMVNLYIQSKGKVVYQTTEPCGGDRFDEAIVEYFRKKNGLLLKTTVAEEVKRRIGTVWDDGKHTAVQVAGYTPYGEKKMTQMSTEEMFYALEEPTAQIVKAVCTAIARIPVPLVKDVFAGGIILTGGGAELRGLDRMVAGITGVNTKIAPDPALAVARGMLYTFERYPTYLMRESDNISKYILSSK